MKKQILLLILMFLPLAASADDSGSCGENVTYTFEEATGTLTISGTGAMKSYSSSTSLPWYSYRKKILKAIVTDGVTSIGNSAFRDCSSLTSVTIPNSVTSIGNTAFYYCSGLTSVHISDLEAWCKITFSNGDSNPLYYAHHLYLNNQEIKNLVIPNSVTSIGEYAFYYCSGLTSVAIPNSVTSIGESAFQGCSGLTSITIPNSVTSIGRCAFYYCSGLTSVTIPNSVTEISGSAFYGCSGLTSVAIPNSVTSIGTNAFYGCSSLTSITIPNSVTSIGNAAFSSCSGLTSITIPNSVTSIGEYAFKNCINMTVATLPENLTIIKKQLFYGCSKLQSITIPATVEYIYQEAFSGTGLTSVKVLATTPPFAYDNTFSNYNIPLYAPEGAISEYQSTNPWSKFASFNTLSGETIETPKCATPTISYGGKKLMFVCDTEDVEFVTEIKDADIGTFYDDRITLSATYEISVYATKAGYENSDVATATLVWGSATFTDTTPATAIEMVPAMEAAMPVLIQNNGGMLTVQGAQDGTPISVYTIAGTEAGSAVRQNSCATISTSMQQGDIAIVRIGNRSVKVVLK